MADLTAQIAEEAAALKEAPVVQPILGETRRCAICGRVFAARDLQPFDAHVGAPRYACVGCHPERSRG